MNKVTLIIQLPKERMVELSAMSLDTGVLKANLVRSWICEKLDAAREVKA